MTGSKLRVVQWTTGIVGKAAVRAMAEHPLLDVVGGFAYSAEKVGQDVGTLCGIGPLGVVATSDVDALIGLKPDCVLYNPLFPDIDVMERILAAGINIVSTSFIISGRAFGEVDRGRLDDAARRGGVSLYGSGVNPGFANVFALISTGVCRNVQRVSVLESVDCTHYASAETWEQCGLGLPIDHPGISSMAEKLTGVFQDAVEMKARALSVDIDEIRYDVEFAEATEKVELGFMTIEKGCATGLRHCWSGLVGGRPVIELPIIWKLGYTMTPDWPLENGYVIEIDGTPSVRSRIEMIHPEGWDAPDFGTVTAMPAVHAIPAVCDAPPGIVLAHELPLIVAAHVTG